MTLTEQRHDAHHDLTWLTGALARALFERAQDDAPTMAALQRVASCDFTAPLAGIRPGKAEACRWLPEAAIAALQEMEEPAMALAAALRHLSWRALPCAVGEAALADVLGTDGPLCCATGGLAVLIAAPDSDITLPGESFGVRATTDPQAARPALLFVLAGEAAYADEHGALRHAGAGEIAHVAGERLRSGTEPLLAAVLAG